MNQQHNITTGPHRWKKGETGNPAGRPIGARQKISERLLNDLATVWEEHGAAVLTRLATEDPAKLAQIAYGLLPKDVFIRVEEAPPGNLAAGRMGNLAPRARYHSSVCAPWHRAGTDFRTDRARVARGIPSKPAYRRTRRYGSVN